MASVPTPINFLRGRMDRTKDLEERIAHLTRAVEDLSDELARRGREVDTLTRRVAMLVAREAEREAERGVVAGDAPAASQKPPHW